MLAAGGFLLDMLRNGNRCNLFWRFRSCQAFLAIDLGLLVHLPAKLHGSNRWESCEAIYDGSLRADSRA